MFDLGFVVFLPAYFVFDGVSCGLMQTFWLLGDCCLMLVSFKQCIC